MNFSIVEIYLVLLYAVVLGYYQHKYRISKLSKVSALRKENIVYLNGAFLFLSFMVMFRNEHIGNDTINYFYNYIRYNPNLTESRLEPGYLFLYKVCRFFFSTPYAIIFVTGGISMLSYYIFIRKYSKWTFFSIIMFVFLGFFDSSMNIIRQAIASGIICYSYKYLQSQNFFKFVVTILIASSFHTTAIIFIFTWFIFRLNLNKKVIFLFGVVTLILYVGFSTILSSTLSLIDKYEGYQETSFGEGGKIGSLFEASIYYILMLNIYIIYRLKGKNNLQHAQLDKLILICLIGIVLETAAFNFNIISRIAGYFNIFQIILIPRALMLLSYRNRLVLGGSLFMILNMYYWTKILLRPEWNLIYPYKTFLGSLF